MNIFEEKDRTGRIIYLSAERWKHIQKHFGASIDKIKQALRYPDTIIKFDDISFYYRYEKEQKNYLFISVKYLNGEGFIITSFYTDKIR